MVLAVLDRKDFEEIAEHHEDAWHSMCRATHGILLTVVLHFKRYFLGYFDGHYGFCGKTRTNFVVDRDSGIEERDGRRGKMRVWHHLLVIQRARDAPLYFPVFSVSVVRSIVFTQHLCSFCFDVLPLCNHSGSRLGSGA